MTKSEARIKSETRMTKSNTYLRAFDAFDTFSSFVIRHLGLIRISGFVIRISAANENGTDPKAGAVFIYRVGGFTGPTARNSR
jgi:hypothetical protein